MMTRRLSSAAPTDSVFCQVLAGLELRFAGDVPLDGVDEDEFLAAGAFVVDPPPFERAFFTQVVDFLDRAGDEFGRCGDGDPDGRALHREADLAVDGRGEHLDKPRVSKNRLRCWRRFSVFRSPAVHQSQSKWAVRRAAGSTMNVSSARRGEGVRRTSTGESRAGLDISRVWAVVFWLEFGTGLWSVLSCTNNSMDTST